MAEQKKLDGNLKRAQKLLKGSDAGWEMSRLLRNAKIGESLAEAVADGSFSVPTAKMRVVYYALAEDTCLSRLSSLAVFEMGCASKDATIRSISEQALAKRRAEEGGHADLIEKIEVYLRPTRRDQPLPMDAPRATAEELAAALGASVEDVVAAMEARIAANTPSQVYHARRHVDGKYSCSRPGPFERVRSPNPFVIEDLVAKGDFVGLDALLALAKGPKDKIRRPDLKWRDGTEVSLGARDWLIGYAKEQGSGQSVLDLFRETLTKDAARALAGEEDLVCVVPQAAAFAAIGAFAHSVSSELLDSISAYLLGRRALLWSELAWPQYRHERSQRWFELCHDAWPTPEEAGDDLQAWNDRAERFLAAAAEAGRIFQRSVFTEFYLNHPLMGPKVHHYDPSSWGGDGSVALRRTAPAEDPRNWFERAEMHLKSTLATWEKVYDFSGMESVTRSSVNKALSTLGFVFEEIDTVSGAVDRDRMALEGMRLYIAEEGRRVVVDRVGVLLQGGAQAWAQRTSEGIDITGPWDQVSEYEFATLGKALAALGVEPVSPGGESPDHWSLNFGYSQGLKGRICLICKQPVESFAMVALRFARASEPLEYSALHEWERHSIRVGWAHGSCSANARKDLMEELFERERERGRDVSGLQ